MNWAMAESFGKIVKRGSGYAIDCGRRAVPRYLYTARKAKLDKLETAQAILTAIRVDIANGTPAQQAVDKFSPVEGSRRGVKRWVDLWLKEQRRRAAQGDISQGYLVETERHVRDKLSWWNDKTLSQINAANCQEWILSFETKRASNHNALKTFRCFVKWLHSPMEQIAHIPAFPEISLPIHVPTIISQRTQFLIIEQIPWDRRGIFLAQVLGVRPGEARAMATKAYTSREGNPGILVSCAMKGPKAKSPLGSTKTGDFGWIPIIIPELDAWIRWRLEQKTGCWMSSALFPNPKARSPHNPLKRWTHDALYCAWNKAAKAVGVKVSLYEGLKHSSATAWRSSGVQLETIQRMLRHADPRSTAIYSKLTDSGLIEAFRKG